MDIFAKLADKIIKEQESIIGPVALEQAKKVKGLTLENGKDIVVEEDKPEVIDRLVKQYATFFGQASIEVCKDAVRGILGDIPKDQIPSSLR